MDEKADKMPDLPEAADELMGFSGLSPAWLTVNRTPDGTVYLTSWWHGVSNVIAVVRPDGSFQQSED